MSVLFVDLVGFTARSERADPEDVREELQLYHAQAKERIEQYGGVLEKFIGDAVMAVFGAPSAHGDDAERAVRAGLRDLEGIRDLNRAHGLGLAARAAVNTGEAVVALDAATGEALATGDVVNTASRLQTAAPEGRLIVGDETYRASRQAIHYEPFGRSWRRGSRTRSARGSRSRRWRLPSVLPPRRRSSGVRRSSTSCGPRGAAVSRSCARTWSRCSAARIGKSRLCREFSAQVLSDGGRILRGRCLPYEEQLGYQAFSRLAFSACGILESDAPSVAREELRAAIDSLMPGREATESFGHLALLLGLAPDDEAPQMQLLFFAARRFIECSGRSSRRCSCSRTSTGRSPARSRSSGTSGSTCATRR